MRSTAIINKSTNITADTALEYRTAYRESAVVKNALQQRQHLKGQIVAPSPALRTPVGPADVHETALRRWSCSFSPCPLLQNSASVPDNLVFLN
jgi:hypothetical protein